MPSATDIISSPAENQPPSQETPPTENPPSADTPPAGDPKPTGDWYGTYSQENQDWIKDRGWASHEEMIRSHVNLEKMRGVPEDKLLKIPHPDDKEARAEMYAKLGRPEKAEDYDLGENFDEDLGSWFKETAHGLGLSVDQAKTFAESLNEQIAKSTELNMEQAAIRAQNEFEEMKRGWGSKADDQLEIAGAGMSVLNEKGISKDTLQQLELLVGAKEYVNLLITLGENTMEPGFPSGDSRAQGNESIEQIDRKIAEMNGDPDYQKRLLSEDANVRKAAVAERKYWYDKREGLVKKS